jgi:hypothetical protein
MEMDILEEQRWKWRMLRVVRLRGAPCGCACGGFGPLQISGDGLSTFRNWREIFVDIVRFLACVKLNEIEERYSFVFRSEEDQTIGGSCLSETHAKMILSHAAGSGLDIFHRAG